MPMKEILEIIFGVQNYSPNKMLSFGSSLSRYCNSYQL